MSNTMFGEAVSEFDDCVVIDHGGRPIWLDKEEFEIIKLPKLNEDERKYYDKIKQLNNGDKRAMTTDVIFGVLNGDCMDFEYGGVYRVVEAVVKGGYN